MLGRNLEKETGCFFFFFFSFFDLFVDGKVAMQGRGNSYL